MAALGLAWPGPSMAATLDPCSDGAIEERVASVSDWRSVELDDGRVLHMAGIESFALLAPDDDAAEAALRSRMAELTSGALVRARLLPGDPDRYGRLPALAWNAAGSIQEILLGEGLAIAFATDDDLPCFDDMLAAEERARRERHGSWSGYALPEATPQALGDLTGRFAIFEGNVLSVGNRPSTTYLNFGTWWQIDVTAEIAERDRAMFGGEEALAGLAGKRIRLRGFLEEKGGPMLALKSPLQLEILGPDARVDGESP